MDDHLRASGFCYSPLMHISFCSSRQSIQTELRTQTPSFCEQAAALVAGILQFLLFWWEAWFLSHAWVFQQRPLPGLGRCLCINLEATKCSLNFYNSLHFPAAIGPKLCSVTCPAIKLMSFSLNSTHDTLYRSENPLRQKISTKNANSTQWAPLIEGKVDSPPVSAYSSSFSSAFKELFISFVQTS